MPLDRIAAPQIPVGTVSQPKPTDVDQEVVARPALPADPVRDEFRRARQEDSEAGELVSRRELFQAIRTAYLPDRRLTDKEKESIAREWGSLFDGAKFHATEDAQRAYARLQKTLDLPVFPIF
ncbi:MAG: hypothetical protein ACT4TC_26545 [Myxococcaceae bacterium]